MIVNLEVPGGRVGTVELMEGSDLGAAARVFCATHGLPDVMVGAMEGYLERELAQVKAKRDREREKKRKGREGWHTTGHVDDSTYLLRTPGWDGGAEGGGPHPAHPPGSGDSGRGGVGSGGGGGAGGGIHSRMYREAVAKQKEAGEREREAQEAEEAELAAGREGLREQLRRNEARIARRGVREGYEVVGARGRGRKRKRAGAAVPRGSGACASRGGATGTRAEGARGGRDGGGDVLAGDLRAGAAA